jgi:hypothetical protein
LYAEWYLFAKNINGNYALIGLLFVNVISSIWLLCLSLWTLLHLRVFRAAYYLLFSVLTGASVLLAVLTRDAEPVGEALYFYATASCPDAPGVSAAETRVCLHRTHYGSFSLVVSDPFGQVARPFDQRDPGWTKIYGFKDFDGPIMSCGLAGYHVIGPFYVVDCAE